MNLLPPEAVRAHMKALPRTERRALRERLAERARVSEITVYRWIAGQRPLLSPVDYVLRLAAAEVLAA